FIIDKLPRTSRFRGERSAPHMLPQPPLQVRRVPDVKPIVLRGMQQVHVEHRVSFLPRQPREAKPFTRTEPAWMTSCAGITCNCPDHENRYASPIGPTTVRRENPQGRSAH